MSCHGITYANILPSWQREIERRVDIASDVVGGARRAVGSAPMRTRALVDSLVSQAEENVSVVRVGRGAHNIGYADELLRAAITFIEEAVRSGGLPYALPDVKLGPRLGENVCLSCHLGVERKVVPFGGREFPHERHVLLAGLACTDCHTSLEQHGTTTLASVTACNACHHRQIDAMNCAACHPGSGGAPERPVEHPIGEFPHGPHVDAGFNCDFCHSSPSMSATELNCDMCHGPHHQPEASCVSCHREGAKQNHALSFAHLQCSQCHGDAVAGIDRWSRQVCTVCHVDRVEHNAPLACDACHQIDPW